MLQLACLNTSFMSRTAGLVCDGVTGCVMGVDVGNRVCDG